VEDNVLKKLRALVGNALTWGLGWAIVGIVPGALIALLSPAAGGQALRVLGAVMLTFGAAGAASGVFFSLILKVVYGRKQLEELRPARVGLWATAGAMAVAFLALRGLSLNGTWLGPQMGWAVLLTAGAFGWVTAAGVTRIAQRSDGALTSGDHGSLRGGGG
jgi:hypothetical protein